MDSSSPQHGEGDAEEDGIYVVIVDDHNDEETQIIAAEDTQQMVQMETEVGNILPSPKEIKEENDSVDLNDDTTEEYLEEHISDNISDEEKQKDNTKRESNVIIEECLYLEEYISDEEEQKGNSKKEPIEKTEVVTKKLRNRPLPQHLQKSFVRELCKMNPELKDDDEALIMKLMKVMKETTCPPLPDNFLSEEEDYLKCSNCKYTVSGKKHQHRQTLAAHWQMKHGPRYLKCLACGVDFNWPSSLYQHEKYCDSLDAWIVLKARDCVLGRKPKANPITPSSKASKAVKSEAKETHAKNKAPKRPISKENCDESPNKKSKFSVSKTEVHKVPSDDVEESLKKLFESDDDEIKLQYEATDEEYDSDPQYKPTIESEDENFSADSDSESKPTKVTNTKRKDNNREVYLETLRVERPDLLQNKDLLVETLVDIMAKEHAPEPPKDFAVLNDKQLYECSSCDSVEKSKMAAARHWQKKHGTLCYKCYACPSQFRDLNNLYRHEKICKSPYAYLVLKARARTIAWTGRNNRPFINDADVKPRKRHQNIINRRTGHYICNQCPLEFPTVAEVKSHELEHRGQKKKPTFRCNDCDAEYNNAAALCHHRTKMHDYKQGTFLCDKCDRTFTMKMDLRKHMDAHSADKKHGCSECERRFKHTMDLKIHIHRDHLKLPHPYACTFCPKRYPRLTQLRQHMIKTHDTNVVRQDNVIRRFMCTKCDKRYALKQDLIYHIDKIHYNLPPPFACTECSLRKYKKSDIKNHMLTEHGIKMSALWIKDTLARPYRVEEIVGTDDASVPDTVKKPDDNQSDPKPNDGQCDPVVIKVDPIAPEQKKHLCTECGKRFHSKRDLTYHVDSVHLDKPRPDYACQLCPKRVSAMFVLQNHMRKCHQMMLIHPKNFAESLPNLSKDQLKSAITVTKTGKVSTLDPTQNVRKIKIETKPSNLLTDRAKFKVIGEKGKTKTKERAKKAAKDEADEEARRKDEHAPDVDSTIEIGGDLESEEQYPETVEQRLESEDSEEQSQKSEEQCLKSEEEYLETEEQYLEALETDDEDIDPPEDLLEVVKKHEEKSVNKPTLVIKDGQAVFLSGENVGYFKKTSNCKINKNPKQITPEVDIQEETSNQLLSYYDRVSKTDEHIKTKVTKVQPIETKVEPRHSTRKRKPNTRWTSLQ